ncbi:MAG: VanZ family protein [Thiomargarita sp.]|nr:VanZ family protein [Thiomargarita sp.]
MYFKKFWLVVGFILVSTVITLSIISSPPNIIPSIQYGDKLGHALAYFTLMAWFAQIYHSSSQRFYLVIGLFLLGITLEILQSLGGIRYAEWQDILANTTGILLAWQLTKQRFGYILFFIEKRILAIIRKF